jgi:hypothetical protein
MSRLPNRLVWVTIPHLGYFKQRIYGVCVTGQRTNTEHPKDTSVPEQLSASDKPPPHQVLAKHLHETAYIYALYGALDGLSLSYSMVKYGFDLINTNKKALSSDLMHEWMASPQGALIAATEALTIISFSLLANTFKANDPNSFKRFIATIWPYLRDTMKGLKNAYKGVRGTMGAFSLLSGMNVASMIVPVGVLLGGLSIVNRIWYRRMRNIRIDMTVKNDKILKAVQSMDNWEGEDCHFIRQNTPPNEDDLASFKSGISATYILCGNKLFYLNRLFGSYDELLLSDAQLTSLEEQFTPSSANITKLDKKQLNELTKITGHQHANLKDTFESQTAFLDSNYYKGIVSQSFGGFIDGLYLYVGVLGLSILAPQMFAVMAAASAFFTVTCIATRMYEEYEYQNNLRLSQYKIEFAVCAKELEALCYETTEMLMQSKAETFTGKKEDAKDKLAAFEKKYKSFVAKREALSDKLTMSNGGAALAGLKSGLAAYSAIGSVLFAIATIYAACSIAIPAAFVIATVAAGLACVIGFTAYMVYKKNHEDTKTKEVISRSEPQELQNLLKKLKRIEIQSHKESDEIQPSYIKDAISQGLVVDPSPQFFFQEIFEVVRSFFSGVAKGQKSVDYTFNALQEPDEDGHYQDPPIMMVITMASSILFSIVLALRALARGFGRPSPGKVEIKLEEKNVEEVPLVEPVKENDKVKPRVKASTEVTQKHRFFRVTDSELIRLQSENNLVFLSSRTEVEEPPRPQTPIDSLFSAS